MKVGLKSITPDIEDDSHAQKEIQLIAREVKEIVKENLPLISSARGYN